MIPNKYPKYIHNLFSGNSKSALKIVIMTKSKARVAKMYPVENLSEYKKYNEIVRKIPLKK